jgi:hypothetical protein
MLRFCPNGQTSIRTMRALRKVSAVSAIHWEPAAAGWLKSCPRQGTIMDRQGKLFEPFGVNTIANGFSRRNCVSSWAESGIPATIGNQQFVETFAQASNCRDAYLHAAFGGRPFDQVGQGGIWVRGDMSKLCIPESEFAEDPRLGPALGIGRGPRGLRPLTRVAVEHQRQPVAILNVAVDHSLPMSLCGILWGFQEGARGVRAVNLETRPELHDLALSFARRISPRLHPCTRARAAVDLSTLPHARGG